MDFKSKIEHSGHYTNDSLTMESVPLHFGYSETHHDTTIFYYSETDQNCNYLPFGKMFYIGIKVNGAFGVHLGWIKVMLNASDIFIYESAIQR